MTQRQLEAIHLTGQTAETGMVRPGKSIASTARKPERTRLFWASGRQWAFFHDFSGQAIDKVRWNLLSSAWLQNAGGVAQLVRAWDS